MASVAVLITLVFLIQEVRQNTETTRSTTYDRAVEALNDWRETIAIDPDLASLWGVYTRNEEDRITGDQELQLRLLLYMLWSVYENAYYAYGRELLGPPEWRRFQAQICRRYELDPSRWSDAAGPTPSVRDTLTEEFVSYVESTC